jgi:uncharacterized protein (TIGR03382 family)
MTVTSLVTNLPQFVSSITAAIQWDPVALIFKTDPRANFMMPSITINGTYEAIGPVHTVSQPFSFVYTPNQQGVQMFARASIPAANPFGDGFNFRLTELALAYSFSASKFFDQEVDGVRFVATRQPLTIFYNAVPEPGSAALAAMALGWVARRRRG